LAYDPLSSPVDGSVFRGTQRLAYDPLSSPWPIDRPRGWLELVNQPQTAAEENAVTLSIERSRPLGSQPWAQRITKAIIPIWDNASQAQRTDWVHAPLGSLAHN
jgi:hypothetical protein